METVTLSEPWPKILKKDFVKYEAPDGYRVFVTGNNFGWGVDKSAKKALRLAGSPQHFLAWIVRGELKVNCFDGGPQVSGEDADIQRIGAKMPAKFFKRQ